MSQGFSRTMCQKGVVLTLQGVQVVPGRFRAPRRKPNRRRLRSTREHALTLYPGVLCAARQRLAASQATEKWPTSGSIPSTKMRREGLRRISSSCRSHYPSEPFSRLFERAWALSFSTRRLAVQIPTIPCATRWASRPVRPRAAAVAMVTDDGQPDGCERHYRRRGSTTW